MSLLAFAWIAVGLVAAATGAKYLLPRLRTLFDGIPFTEVTETDDSWLSELPAVDTTYRTARATGDAWIDDRIRSERDPGRRAAWRTIRDQNWGDDQ